METAIIATNLSETEVQFWVDLTDLEKLYKDIYPNNSVIMINNWIQTD